MSIHGIIPTQIILFYQTWKKLYNNNNYEQCDQKSIIQIKLKKKMKQNGKEYTIKRE